MICFAASLTLHDPLYVYLDSRTSLGDCINDLWIGECSCKALSALDKFSMLQEKVIQLIEIVEFVSQPVIPRAYYDKTYDFSGYKRKNRTPPLLSQAKRRTRRATLTRYAAHGKMDLGWAMSAGDRMAKTEGSLTQSKHQLIGCYNHKTLNHPRGINNRGVCDVHRLDHVDEFVFKDVVSGWDTEVKYSELALAIQIIRQISVDESTPQNYENRVRKRIKGLFEQKVAGEETGDVAPVETLLSDGVTDLMAMLKASLGVSRTDVAATSLNLRRQGRRPMMMRIRGFCKIHAGF